MLMALDRDEIFAKLFVWNIEISNPIIQFPFPVVHHRFHLQWLYFSHCWCRKSSLHRVAGCHYETFNLSDWHGHQTGPPWTSLISATTQPLWWRFLTPSGTTTSFVHGFPLWSTGQIILWSTKEMLDSISEFWMFAPEGGHPVAGISLPGYWPDRLDQATRAL